MNVFARVTAYLYPETVHQFFAYQDQIQGYNQNFPPETWLKYDNAFRLAQAVTDKSLSWDRTDDYTFNKFFWVIPAKPTQMANQIRCFRCGELGHTGTSCSQPPALQQQTFCPTATNMQNTWPSPSGNHSFPSCLVFNKNGTCSYPACLHKNNHYCNRAECGGPHPGRACLKYR